MLRSLPPGKWSLSVASTWSLLLNSVPVSSLHEVWKLSVLVVRRGPLGGKASSSLAFSWVSRHHYLLIHASFLAMLVMLELLESIVSFLILIANFLDVKFFSELFLDYVVAFYFIRFSRCTPDTSPPRSASLTSSSRSTSLTSSLPLFLFLFIAQEEWCSFPLTLWYFWLLLILWWWLLTLLPLGLNLLRFYNHLFLFLISISVNIFHPLDTSWSCHFL